jgi:transcriptional regulator with XRE-family HTH domain
MLEVNEKVFNFIQALKSSGRIEFDNDFCEAIGLKKQNLNNIKNGKNFFATKHINQICKVFGANANYFFGTEDNMFRRLKSK